MKWFRMYSEARTDAKLESLTDDEFRVWFKLLCFANEQETRGCIVLKNKRLLAVEVARANVGLLNQTLEVLSELEIIHESDNTIQFIHWDKRQFESDTSTNRWRKWRDKQQSNVGQTLDKQQPTPPDTDTDTDTDIKKKDHVCVDESIIQISDAKQQSAATNEKVQKEKSDMEIQFNSLWEGYPKKDARKAALAKYVAQRRKGVSHETLLKATENYAKKVKGFEKKYIMLGSTFFGPDDRYTDFLEEDKPESASVEPVKQVIDSDALIKKIEEQKKAEREEWMTCQHSV